MRIVAFITPCIKVPVSGYGGLEQTAYLILEELGKTNDVYVVAAKGSSFKNCKYIEGIEEGYSTPTENRELTQLNKVKKQMIELNADIYDFHIHDPNIIPEQIRDKSVFEAHDFTPPLVFPFPKMIVARSEFHKRFLEGLYGYACEFVYNCVDVSSFPFSIKKEDYFLFLSRITKEKGIFNLIKIAKDFPNEHFIVAGEDSAEKGIDQVQLGNFLSQIPENVEYLSKISEEKKRELLRKAKALILPYDESYAEIFGNIFIESWACGTPVFTLNNGSPEELFKGKGLTKYGFVAESLEELEQALKDFVEGKIAFRAKFLRQRAEEFTPEKIAQKYIELFKKAKEI
jgi:glycosyltransferase involved in cell wall biosynthesis